jgi:hypothetical protein
MYIYTVASPEWIWISLSLSLSLSITLILYLPPIDQCCPEHIIYID